MAQRMTEPVLTTIKDADGNVIEQRTELETFEVPDPDARLNAWITERAILVGGQQLPGLYVNRATVIDVDEHGFAPNDHFHLLVVGFILENSPRIDDEVADVVDHVAFDADPREALNKLVTEMHDSLKLTPVPPTN